MNHAFAVWGISIELLHPEVSLLIVEGAEGEEEEGHLDLFYSDSLDNYIQTSKICIANNTNNKS